MKSLQKVAIFLLVIGLTRGKSIISLMDNDEIRSVVPAINKLSEISEEVQKRVWSEFEQLGYEENMSPSDTLYIMRLLFNNSKINNKDG